MHSTLENGSNSRGNSPSLAMVLSQLCWGGSPSILYPSYEGRNEVATDGGGGAPAGGSPAAPNVPAAAAVGTGTPAATPASPADGGTPASPAGGTPPGTPGTPSNDDNLRVLRQNYESLKPWEQAAKAIKDPAQAVQAHQRVTKMYNDGLALAKALNYTEESYKAAFEDDPVDTLSHLRGEHAKANPNAAQDERIRKAAEQAAQNATRPITQQLNKQQTEAAVQRLQTEFDRLVADEQLGFGKDTPQEVKDAVWDLMDILLPDTVLAEIKTQGKLSGVQAAFDQAKGALLKVVTAYNGMVTKRGVAVATAAGGKRTVAAPNASASSKLTLDDIINDPEASLPGLKAGKY